MRLVNAKLYDGEIQRRLYEIWYDEKYQWYFGGLRRYEQQLYSGDCPLYAFAVLNDKDELIGQIRYYVDTDARVAKRFGAINFSDEKFTFALALQQVITDCFLKFGMNVVEWNVMCGNPIEESYDRICAKLGGHIVGVKHRRIPDIQGNLHDDKIYEILREDFLRVMKQTENSDPTDNIVFLALYRRVASTIVYYPMDEIMYADWYNGVQKDFFTDTCELDKQLQTIPIGKLYSSADEYAAKFIQAYHSYVESLSHNVEEKPGPDGLIHYQGDSATVHAVEMKMNYLSDLYEIMMREITTCERRGRMKPTATAGEYTEPEDLEQYQEKFKATEVAEDNKEESV